MSSTTAIPVRFQAACEALAPVESTPVNPVNITQLGNLSNPLLGVSRAQPLQLTKNPYLSTVPFLSLDAGTFNTANASTMNNTNQQIFMRNVANSNTNVVALKVALFSNFGNGSSGWADDWYLPLYHL